jgi:hypothetical protein
MGKHKPYNGHRNRNAWNVSLWLSNDEGLYNLMRDYIRRAPNKDTAAARMAEDFAGQKTPDGAPYSKTAIRLAMTGI